MAEVNKTASAGGSGSGAGHGAGFELRLERGGVSVRLADQPVVPGLRLEALVLAVPDVRFPFDVGQGAAQFRHRLSDLVRVEVIADASLLEAAIAALDLSSVGVADVRAALRVGFAEIAGRVVGGPGFTLKAGLVPSGEDGLAIVFHSARLYGPAPMPAAALPHLAARAAERAGASSQALAPILRRILAPRGWKLPRAREAHLARAEVQPNGARIAWASDEPGPAVLAADADLLAADEGGRAFAEAEALLAAGEPGRARDAYLAAGAAATSHPFAAERLLSLLCLEDRFHDEALDLAHEWLSRRPAFAPALAAEAWVRLARGEEARAAAALAALADTAAGRGEGLSTLAAADALFAIPGADGDALAKGIEAALAIRRDHVPALRALRTLSTATGDREGLVRANGRLVAYAESDAEKARAHAELGGLLLAADPPAARLHLDHALRLAPDDPEALAALARACDGAGEHLRAVRAHERLKEVLLGRGDGAGAARAALDAGALWEERLAHPENALLRYREACELAPGDGSAHARAAAVAERLGHWVEASDHHAAVLGAIDTATPEGRALAVRTHVALADVAERRLSDPAAAASHLESAASLAPAAETLRRLADLYRGLSRPPELLAALDRLAPMIELAPERAALLAEAGAAALSLGRPDPARSRFAAALALDPSCRPAIEGLARLAADRGDAHAEKDALARLAPLVPDAAEQAAVLDRLAAACERAGDVAGASRAVGQARRAQPTPARLGEAIRLARRSGDAAALPALLGERAEAARAEGDAGGATSALVERARLLAPAEPAAALATLADARSLSPGDPAVLRAQADLAERVRDPVLALGCLRALLAGAPEDAPALELRAGRTALAGGEPDAAREHAERARALGEPGADELLSEILDRTGDAAGRAELLERLGRHAEAAAVWEKTGDLSRARAALDVAADDPRLARDALPRVAELRERAGDAEGAAAALLRLARLTGGREGALLAMRAHALVPSGEALADAIAYAPDLAVARAARAARLENEDPRAAREDAEAALAAGGLAADPRRDLLRLAARTAARLGDAAAARRHLEAYCADAADDDAALAELAEIHRAAGAADRLAAVLDRRVRLATGAAAVALRLELAVLHGARGRTSEAARLVREAVAFDPAAVAPLRALLEPGVADALPAAERRGLLTRLAEHPGASPEEATAALGARARLLASEGNAAAALDALREAARRAPESDAALELRAELAQVAGERTEAARARLARAERARERSDPDAPTWLAEAGLAAADAGLDAEAEVALTTAAALPLARDDARAVLGALAALAAARGDASAEREALARLVPIVPTGDRPGRLLRLAALAADAGDLRAARAAADEARALAPRDPAAVDGARAAALAEGDLAAVADRLGELAALVPDEAGARLLERARILAGLARFEEADAAYAAALQALPPDRSVADEHARLRRTHLPAVAASEPLEAFAGRTPDGAAAADALRAAAALAIEGDVRGTALRCARKAWARTREMPSFIAPLLARLLYEQGALSEALVLHRALFDAGLPALGPDDAVALCRQLSELADDAGERDLAVAALDRLLAAKPQDMDAAERRFALDPDRARAVRRLAEASDATRSIRRRARALALAGAGALVELSEAALAERLHRRARLEAERSLGVAAEVARIRADALRAREPGSLSLLAALHDAADAAAHAGDGPSARALLSEAVALERGRDLAADVPRDLLRLEALAAADGDDAAAAEHAREAAELLLEAGDADAAARAAHAAAGRAPADERAWALLERAARALGSSGDAILAEAATVRGRILLGRARAEEDPSARVGLLRAGAEALQSSASEADRALAGEAWVEIAALQPDDVSAARGAAAHLLATGQRDSAIPHLAAVVRSDPDDDATARELEALYAERHRDRAELFLARAAQAQGQVRAQRLREAAKALLASGDDVRARAVQREAFDAWPADDPSFFAAIRDAASDVERLDTVLAARARAVPAEEAGCHHARADALAAFGHTDRAIAAYEACAALEPEDARALASLAALVAQVRGDEAAAEVDGRICALAERADVVPAIEAQSRFRIGLVAWAQGRAADAVPQLDRALALAPDDARAGLAWAALASGRAALGDGDGALAAARRRADRAAALGLAEERSVALEAGADLAASLGDAGPDAAAILEGLLALHADAGAAPEALDALARRAAGALRAAGADDRADAALARAGLAGTPRDETPAPVDVDAHEAVLEAGPGGADFAAAAEALTRYYEARGELRAAARVHAREADAAYTPAGRAAAWVASADALARGDAAPEDVRDALDVAAAADPEAPEPWRVRAAFETRLGDRLGAARAHLAVSIRTEGDEAARAALEAARLFEEEHRHADAARAYRAAVLACPGCVPARRVLAQEALAGGDAAAAAEHLAAIAPDDLNAEARPEHGRALARALEAAGRAEEAEAAWARMFELEPADADAFSHVSALALARGGVDAWGELAERHDAALASSGDRLRRRDLRHERGRLLAESGRLEAARDAFLAALELDPSHARTAEALAALDARKREWAAAADERAAEAEAATDRAEAAALQLRRARILHDRLGDREGAAAALGEALVRARLSDVPAAHRIAQEAEAMLAEVGAAAPDEPGPAQAEGGAGPPPIDAAPSAAAPWSFDALGGEDAAPEHEAGVSSVEPTATLAALGAAPPDGARAAPSPEPPGSLEAELELEDVDEVSLVTPSPLAASADGELPSGSPPAEGALPGAPVELPVVPEDGEAVFDASVLEDLPPLDLFEPEPSPTPADVAPAPTRELACAMPADDGPTTSAAAAAIRAEIAASFDAPAAEQARMRRELARVLEADSDLEGAADALLGAHAADPSDAATVERLARVQERAGRPVDAIGAWEAAAELSLDGAALAARLASLGDQAEALGAEDRAHALFERARAIDPQLAPALAGVLRRSARRGDRARVVQLARELESVAGADSLAPVSAAIGHGLLEAGDIEAAHARLEAAFRDDPFDLAVAQDLFRAAEKLGRHDEYVRLAEVCADAISGQDPLAAAARYRQLAEVALERLTDPDRAAVLLEKALGLVPDDAEARRALLRTWAARPERAARAVEGWLELARADPSDGAALLAVAAASHAPAEDAEPDLAARLVERARLCTSLAAFASPSDAAAPPLRLAPAIPAEVRERVAAPGATGPLARLLQVLAPWLEPLFPADLARRGASPKDRLVPPRARALRAALDGAAAALGARPHAVFLADRPGWDMALENTSPPALVAAAGAEALPPGALHFVAARTLDLLDRGWTLVGKFAPNDLAILLELACRFAGGAPPPMGLPSQRADLFLAALERSVPRETREAARKLGSSATDELARTDPRAFAAALRRTANRVAILYTGDPGAALDALGRFDRRLESGSDPARALELPDLRDVALFALSDPFLDLRIAVLG